MDDPIDPQPQRERQRADDAPTSDHLPQSDEPSAQADTDLLSRDDDQPEPDTQLRLALEAEQEQNRDLLERLRLALLATDLAIDPSLVRGDTAAEVEDSFQAAKRMADAIRESVQRQARIPAGAPGRSPSAPRSAYDKIRSGLSRLN